MYSILRKLSGRRPEEAAFIEAPKTIFVPITTR